MCLLPLADDADVFVTLVRPLTEQERLRCMGAYFCPWRPADPLPICLCEDPLCLRDGQPYYLPNLEGEELPPLYFCGVHAHQEGFCWMCGGFFGGIESFEFGGGICDDCRYEQERMEERDEFDPDTSYDPYDDLP